MGVITKEGIQKVAQLFELKYGYRKWREDLIEMPFTVSEAVLKLYMVNYTKNMYIRPKAAHILNHMSDPNSLDELYESFKIIEDAYMQYEYFGNYRQNSGAMNDLILLLRDQLEDVPGKDNRERLLTWLKDVKVYELQHFAPRTFTPTGLQWLKRMCGYNAAVAGQKSMSAMRRYFGGSDIDKFSAVYVYEEIGKLKGCDMDYLRLNVENGYVTNPKVVADLRATTTNLLDDLVKHYSDDEL